jgi:hypothetical protein
MPVEPQLEKPSCFICYSTREPHAGVLIDCVRLVLGKHFEIRLTPSAMESGASQRDQITELIERCSFGIVILDGLRPNVVFEYGILHGKKKPVLLFKEENAVVDIRGLIGDIKELGITSPPVNPDLQFSDVKDVNYAKWDRFKIPETIKLVWDEYCKKKSAITNFVEIEELKLWR